MSEDFCEWATAFTAAFFLGVALGCAPMPGPEMVPDAGAPDAGPSDCDEVEAHLEALGCPLPSGGCESFQSGRSDLVNLDCLVQAVDCASASLCDVD